MLSQWLDIPSIGIRNFLLPYIVRKPAELDTFFVNDLWKTLDLRHMNSLGQISIADMVIACDRLCFD